MNLEDMLTADQVAERLGVTVSAVHRLANRCTLPYKWVTNRKLFSKASIDKYLADSELQRRRRNGSLISQGELELTVDQATRRMRSEASVDALRPLGSPRPGDPVVF